MKKKIDKYIKLPRDIADPLTKTRLGLAVLIIIMLVSQLFTFEKLPNAMLDLGIPGGILAGNIAAISLVIVELCSLPYLLNVALPPRLAKYSKMMVLCSGVLIWLLHSWGYGAVRESASVIFFGATVKLPLGFWAVVVASVYLLVCILALWARQITHYLDRLEKKTK